MSYIKLTNAHDGAEHYVSTYLVTSFSGPADGPTDLIISGGSTFSRDSSSWSLTVTETPKRVTSLLASAARKADANRVKQAAAVRALLPQLP